MSEISTDILLPVPKNQDEKDLYNAISERLREIAEAINDNMFLPATGAYYFGDIETNGSWRIIRDGNNLVHQRLETGTWTTKNTITP